MFNRETFLCLLSRHRFCAAVVCRPGVGVAPEDHLHPRRRCRLRRPRVLREQVHQDAEPRPHGRRGHEVHAGLRRRHRLHAFVRGAHDRASHRPRLPARQRRQELPQAGHHHRRGAQGAGYATGAIGKWGLAAHGTDGVPTKKGFDFFYGYLTNYHAHNYYPPFLWRNDEKEPLPNVLSPQTKAKDGRGVAVKKVRYSNDLFRDEALKFLDAHKDKTFFLYLPFTIPHANNEAFHQTGNGMEVPDLGEYADRKDWPEPLKGQAAMISRLATATWGNLKSAERLRGLDDTHRLLHLRQRPAQGSRLRSTAHGSSGPFRGHSSATFYEGGVREPFIAGWPGHVPEEDDGPDHLVSRHDADVRRTRGRRSLKAPEERRRVDRPNAAGHPDQQKQPPYLYWEFYEQGTKQAVREGDWKAIRMPMLTGKTELYNLKSDPSEEHNIAAEHPDVVKHMQQLMDERHLPGAGPIEGQGHGEGRGIA